MRCSILCRVRFLVLTFVAAAAGLAVAPAWATTHEYDALGRVVIPHCSVALKGTPSQKLHLTDRCEAHTPIATMRPSPSYLNRKKNCFVRSFNL